MLGWFFWIGVAGGGSCYRSVFLVAFGGLRGGVGDAKAAGGGRGIGGDVMVPRNALAN